MNVALLTKAPVLIKNLFRFRFERAIAIIAGLVAFMAISSLTYNVVREIRLLGSARSDNVQWALAQTQVEFLEFTIQLNETNLDLVKLRQRFDVFYSRITTVRSATVFENLRENANVRVILNVLDTFLEETAPLIDASDIKLQAQIQEISLSAEKIRLNVRELNNLGLKLFAQESDDQRLALANTMTRLALAVASLVGVLILAIFCLNYLNARITKRESDLKQSATRMKTIMGTSLDGVIVCDDNGIILEFNPAAEAMFGTIEEDVLKKKIGDVIVPDYLRAAHEAGIKRMQANGEKRVVGKGRVRLEARHSSDRIFPVELAIQTAETDQGDVFIAFLRDISHRVAAESELVVARDKALASEKMKTEFLSTMSHEIRTPLNGLLGNMNLLRDTNLNPKQERFIGYMETSGRLLMNHISDVLDITRYDAGKLSARSEPVNVSALFQDIVDNQSGAAFNNSTSLTWNWIGNPMDWVTSDHDRLQHVMMNLIGNAVKFTKDGEVSVSVENIGNAQEPELLVKIVDTGPGMSDELSARVFEDFVTGTTAYDREVGGTGLGLSIAKRFVSALGGEIGVESVLGKGSTFWFKMPVETAEEPAPIVDEKIALISDRPLNVLLVEDNEINRIVAREMLLAEGHSVVEAHDGRQGVHAAKDTKFDFILMDISMPVMDGRTATRTIRRENGQSSDTIIVALTANAIVEEQVEFIKDGMNEILTKPLSRKALRNLLQQTQSQRESEDVVYVDHTHSAETRDVLGEAPFAEMINRFASEVDELGSYFADKTTSDFSDTAKRAHSITGSAAIFGAVRLRETLKELENAAKSENQSEVKKRIEDFHSVWERTKPALFI